MPLDDIPEVPPYPIKHSIVLHPFLEVFRSHDHGHDTHDKVENFGTVHPANFIPDTEPQPLSHAVDLFLIQDAHRSAFLECRPIPARHEVTLSSFTDVSRPIPDMDAGSQLMSIPMGHQDPAARTSTTGTTSDLHEGLSHNESGLEGAAPMHTSLAGHATVDRAENIFEHIATSNTLITGDTLVTMGEGSVIQTHTHPTIDVEGRQGMRKLETMIARGAFHNAAERYNPPRCHPETRKAVLEKIMDWVQGLEDSERRYYFMWLYGPEAEGKSAIAQTIAELCHELKLLAASFFFSMTTLDRSDMSHFIATLTYQLCLSIPEIRHHVEDAVELNPNIFSLSIENQLQTLILDPMVHFRDNLSRYHGGIHPMLIIIDGLDECDSEEYGQYNMLQILAEKLPVPMFFLVTSRPKPHIGDFFMAEPMASITTTLALDNPYQPDADFKIFLNTKFYANKRDHRLRRESRRREGSLLGSWPEIDDQESDADVEPSFRFQYDASDRGHPLRRDSRDPLPESWPQIDDQLDADIKPSMNAKFDASKRGHPLLRRDSRDSLPESWPQIDDQPDADIKPSMKAKFDASKRGHPLLRRDSRDSLPESWPQIDDQPDADIKPSMKAKFDASKRGHPLLRRDSRDSLPESWPQIDDQPDADIKPSMKAKFDASKRGHPLLRRDSRDSLPESWPQIDDQPDADIKPSVKAKIDASKQGHPLPKHEPRDSLPESWPQIDDQSDADVKLFLKAKVEASKRGHRLGRELPGSGPSIVQIDYQPDADVKVFLNAKFDAIKRDHPLRRELPESWPSTVHIDKLIRESSGQFIYPSTVMKYIESPRHRPTDRLEIMLGIMDHGKDSPFAALDVLYTHIFSSVEDINTVLEVFSVLLLERPKTTLKTPALIEDLLGLRRGDLNIVLIDLHSILDIPAHPDEGEIRVLHTSLEGFLLDDERSGHYHIDQGHAHANLTQRFMKCIPQQIRGDDNISVLCGLSSAIFTVHCSQSYPTEELLDALWTFDISSFWVLYFSGNWNKTFTSELIFPRATHLSYFFSWLANNESSRDGQDLDYHYISTWDGYMRHSLTQLSLGPLESQYIVFFVLNEIRNSYLAQDVFNPATCGADYGLFSNISSTLELHDGDMRGGDHLYDLLLAEFFGDPSRSGPFYLDGDKYADFAMTFTKYILSPRTGQQNWEDDLSRLSIILSKASYSNELATLLNSRLLVKARDLGLAQTATDIMAYCMRNTPSFDNRSAAPHIEDSGAVIGDDAEDDAPSYNNVSRGPES